MRGCSKFLAAVATAGMVIATFAPAHAANGVAAGEMTALVTIQPGISGFSASPQHWTMGTTIFSGAFVSDDSSQQYIGAFGVDDMTMDRTSGGDLPDEAGKVNPFAWDTDEGFPGVGSLKAGSCSGTYSRLGIVLQLTLNCSVYINKTPTEGSQPNFHATFKVISNLVPVTGNGIQNPITQAAMTGAFESVA